MTHPATVDEALELRWRAFSLADDLCERIADGGPGRLARSAV